LKKITLRLLAILMLIVGLITLPLPLPTGLPLLVVGLSLLISTSQQFSNYVKRFRDKNPEINEKIQSVEKKIPTRFLRFALLKTRPKKRLTKMEKSENF
jgi:ABC-type nickel/cobalt efflux system permease component RcnA